MEAIEIRDLVKCYGANVAVDHVNMSIDEGEIYGLIGPNGAGKSTIIRALLGIMTYDRGAVRVAGVDLRARDARERVRIGYLPQQAAFQEWRTVESALIALGRLSGMDGTRLNTRIDEVLEQLGIEEYRKIRVGKLSGGTLQKLGLAQAIVHEPMVLIMDEPMAALDPSSRYQFKQVVREMRDAGTTVLFSSHILTDVEDLADKVGLLIQGMMRYSGPVSGLERLATMRSELVIELADDACKCGSLDIPGVDIHRPSSRIIVANIDDPERWDEITPCILESLVAAGCKVQGMSRTRPSLEDVYMKAVGGSQ